MPFQAVVCSRALGYNVHSLFGKNIDDDHASEHALAIRDSIHGTDKMLLRGSYSVEHEDETWRLIWTEDVLNVLGQSQHDYIQPDKKAPGGVYHSPGNFLCGVPLPNLLLSAMLLRRLDS